MSPQILAPVFVTLDVSFGTTAFTALNFVDMSGDRALVALTDGGVVYSQNVGSFDIVQVGANLNQTGAAVDAIYARSVAFAVLGPAKLTISAGSSVPTVGKSAISFRAAEHFFEGSSSVTMSQEYTDPTETVRTLEYDVTVSHPSMPTSRSFSLRSGSQV